MIRGRTEPGDLSRVVLQRVHDAGEAGLSGSVLRTDMLSLACVPGNKEKGGPSWLTSEQFAHGGLAAGLVSQYADPGVSIAAHG